MTAPAADWVTRARATHARIAIAAVLTACLAGLALPTPSMGVQVVLLSAGVATLGMPHGAMDHRVAEAWLAPRFGRRWGPMFGVAYVGLAAAVLAAWGLAPLATLAAFLAYSSLHFGAGDAKDGNLVVVVARGVLPIALPFAVRPSATADLLGQVAGVPVAAETWHALAVVIAVLACAGVVVHSAVSIDPRAAKMTSVVECVALVGANVIFPPLLAFGLYFVCLHSVRHLIELAGWLEPADPARGVRRLAREAMPLTAVALLLTACGYVVQPHGSPAPAVIRAVFVALSALTVPHMLLTEWVARTTRAKKL